MNTQSSTAMPVAKYGRIAAIVMLAASLTACATHDRKQNNTLLGAGLGAATGAVVSQGNPWLTLGGAAAGGVLGNVLTPKEKSRSASSHRNRKAAAPRARPAKKRQHVRDTPARPPRPAYNAPKRKAGPVRTNAASRPAKPRPRPGAHPRRS